MRKEFGFIFSRKEPAGFTLVEVLVAISILAIIGAVVAPNLKGFNDSQTLQNAANDLVRVLRQAQSSANSRIGCGGNLISRNWGVNIINNNSFSLINLCYDPSSGAPSTTQTFYSSNLPSTIQIAPQTLSASCGGRGITVRIRFLSEYQPYTQPTPFFGSNRFTNIDFGCGSQTDENLRITISYLGQNYYVCLNKGGAIYATSTACPL